MSVIAVLAAGDRPTPPGRPSEGTACFQFSTSSGGADFSLHNYTPIAGLLGMPLIDGFGVVGVFNLVLLVFVCSSGLATFVLARRLGLGPVAAWIAGAAFMASPVLTGRETAHISLVTAAPLPLFLWALLDFWNRNSAMRASDTLPPVTLITTAADARANSYEARSRSLR